MYTLAEFNQLQTENEALKVKIETMEREQRAIDKQRNAIDRYYSKRVQQTLTLLKSDALNITQVSALTGFSRRQIGKIISENPLV